MLKLHIKYASFGICQKMRKCSLTYPFDINIHTNYRLKIDKDLRGRFLQYKAEDAARLMPCRDDNAVLRKLDRKDCLFSVGN